MRIDPKCWLCGRVQQPNKEYNPLICDTCMPEYRKKKFFWSRPSNEEVERLFGKNERPEPETT